MHYFRGITATRVGIFVALIFGAVTLLALGFQLAGYLNPELARVFYAAAFLLLVGSFIALFWRPHGRETPDEYFTQMEEWLHGPDAQLRQDDSVRLSAQERTIGILPGLSPDGKRRVIRFLHRHELIQVGTAIISLRHADLRRANLSSLGLQGVLITDANLSKADLSDAKFCNYKPTGADWERVDLTRFGRHISVTQRRLLPV
jgi:hypothetical protein